jgi:hypothetical protein
MVSVTRLSKLGLRMCLQDEVLACTVLVEGFWRWGLGLLQRWAQRQAAAAGWCGACNACVQDG